MAKASAAITMRLLPLLALLFSLPLQAHLGSPDVFLQGSAGPYRLWVTVRPPDVIPGVATVEVRSDPHSLTRLEVTPLPLAGTEAKLAPVPEVLKTSVESPDFYTGSIWMMRPGSWQLRLHAYGSKGDGTLGVPVPAMALKMKGMQHGLGIALSMMMGVLVFGLVAIAGASAGEATLPPGVMPDQKLRRRSRLTMMITVLAVFGLLAWGHRWWQQSETEYGESLYRPLQMHSSIVHGVLNLRLIDPGWLPMRKVDDLALDHEHLMHLYAIRKPGMDVVFHLHPEQVGSGQFRLPLPAMPAGSYQLYADVVHEDGFPETLTSSLGVETTGAFRGPLRGDDAEGQMASSRLGSVFHLADGSTMTWLNAKAPLQARQMNVFRFRLLGPDGRAPKNMQLYMGMLGHAAFVKSDFTTFAHVHPDGSANMAAYMMAQNEMAGMAADEGMLPNEVSFPYGFPKPGRYRIFIQMRRGNTIETGAFDASVQ